MSQFKMTNEIINEKENSFETLTPISKRLNLVKAWEQKGRKWHLQKIYLLTGRLNSQLILSGDG